MKKGPAREVSQGTSGKAYLPDRRAASRLTGRIRRTPKAAELGTMEGSKSLKTPSHGIGQPEHFLSADLLMGEMTDVLTVRYSKLRASDRYVQKTEPFRLAG